MSEVFKEGDRVRLVPSDNWKQPMRGWAERERMATVQRTYRTTPSDNPRVIIRFDRARGKGILGCDDFSANDLILVARNITPTQNKGAD